MKGNEKQRVFSLPTFLYVGVALLCVCTLFGTVVTRTYARYTSQGIGGDNARVAGWTFDVTAEGTDTAVITLDEIKKPGDSQTLEFTFQNFTTTVVCETAISYYFEIEHTNNLPLQYSLQLVSADNGTAPNIGDTTDSGIRAEGGMFRPTEQGTHKYKLTVTWPESEVSFALHEKIDLLTVTVKANQID